MKKILIVLLLMLSGASINLQAQIELELLKAKGDLTIAKNLDPVITSNVDGFLNFSIRTYSDKKIFNIVGEDCLSSGSINLGNNYVVYKWYAYWLEINSPLTVSLSVKQGNDFQTLVFTRDQYGQGGYFILDENGPILFRGNRYSLQSAAQILTFQNNLREILKAVKLAVLNNQAKNLSTLGWAKPDKRIRLIKQKATFGDYPYHTNIILLEKYERDSLFSDINKRPPDTILSYRDIFKIKEWYLDKNKRMAYLLTEEPGDGGYITFQDKSHRYLLYLQSNKMDILYLRLDSHSFGKIGDTRLISFRRWFNLGIPQAKLNMIKTELFAGLKK